MMQVSWCRLTFPRSVNLLKKQNAKLSIKTIVSSKWSKIAIASGLVSVGLIGFAAPVYASELLAHGAKLPWTHKGLLSAYDHASLRRGYQVYKEVCSACHSLNFVCYRHLVNVMLTEEEAKEQAAEARILDGPGEDGQMFERPGRLSDFIPAPYANEVVARNANGGALPPDLSFIVLAREGGQDYVFHLLTGYMDPPPGREVAEDQYYNPYFPGGALGMAQNLYDELLEYPDGTPAHASQLAKDVVAFLTWVSDRHHDDRKRILFKVILLMSTFVLLLNYGMRKNWSIIKTRKVIYKNRPIPKDL